MGGMWVFVPSIHGRRLPACHKGPQGGLYDRLTGKEEAKLTLTFLLGGFFFQLCGWTWCVFGEVSQPGQLPGPPPP